MTAPYIKVEFIAQWDDVELRRNINNLDFQLQSLSHQMAQAQELLNRMIEEQALRAAKRTS
jgi:hypothetical protein